MKIDFTKISAVGSFLLMIFAVVGGGYGGYTWLKTKGAEEAQQLELMFPSPEVKHRTIIHVTDTEEVIDELKSLLKAEKENAEAAKKSRSKRDSIQEAYLDLARRNAVDAHQNKQGIDSVLKLWEAYNESSQ